MSKKNKGIISISPRCEPSINIRKVNNGYVISTWTGDGDKTVVATNEAQMKKALNAMLGGEKKK